MKVRFSKRLVIITFLGLMFLSVNAFAQSQEERLSGQGGDLNKASYVQDNEIKNIEPQVNSIGEVPKSEKENDEQIGESNQLQATNNSNKDPLKSILLALGGLLGISLIAPSLSERIKAKIPEGNGLWVVEKDRVNVKNMLNDSATKSYNIDDKGFVKENIDGNKNIKGSVSVTDMTDKLINAKHKTVIGLDNKVAKYDENKNVVEKSISAGMTVGKANTDQTIILNPDVIGDGKTKESQSMLGHELAHAVDGVAGTKSNDAKNNENYALNLENQVRKDFGLVERTSLTNSDGSELYSPLTLASFGSSAAYVLGKIKGISVVSARSLLKRNPWYLGLQIGGKLGGGWVIKSY